MKNKNQLINVRIERIVGSLLLACMLLASLFVSATPTEAVVDAASSSSSSVSREAGERIDVARSAPIGIANQFVANLVPEASDLAVGHQSNMRETLPVSDTGGIRLNSNPTWLSSTRDFTTSMAWGDVDGDGDLDLAVGNGVIYDADCRCDIGGQNQIYLNDGGELEDEASWSSTERDDTTSVAWADVDGDGDLDLGVGNKQIRNTNNECPFTGTQNKVYLNVGGTLETEASWQSDEADFTTSIAWGDVNGDGHFDLAVGNSVPGAEQSCQPTLNNRVYLNTGNGLESTASWVSSEEEESSSVAWGDADGDGDLDLVVGNFGTNRLYQNDGGALNSSTALDSTGVYSTTSVTWADMDLDDDLDLAVGNMDHVAQLYLNENGNLGTPSELEADSEGVLSFALGDADNDGDLDLATGHDKQKIAYHNKNGELRVTWVVNERDRNNSVAWADFDSDGDLDLAVGSGRRVSGQQNKIYVNQTIPLGDPHYSQETDNSVSVAWGDVDLDGDLDLAVGNIGRGSGTDKRNKLYLNDHGQLSPQSNWESNDREGTYDVAWGDVDGDGDLDLMAGNASFFNSECECYEAGQNKLYLNEGGTLERTPSWVSQEYSFTNSVAWADIDSDGDLDLAVGNEPLLDEECDCLTGGQNQLYLNEHGMLSSAATWSSDERDFTNSVAWADADGDGDLDLAVGNDGANRLYLNDSGTLSLAWSSTDSDNTLSVAWADFDADGDLDLMFGNYLTPNKLYRNEDGVFSLAWSDQSSFSTTTVAWADPDGDGDLDLVVGNLEEGIKFYSNNQGQLDATDDETLELLNTESTQDMAWADVDLDGDLDLALGIEGQNQLYLNQLSSRRLHGGQTPTIAIQPKFAPADFYATPKIRSGKIISVPYKLTEADQIDEVRGFFSPDGGGRWLPAVEADPGGFDPSANGHTYRWHLSESNFFGQSDNVVFRLQALLKHSGSTNNVPGPFILPSISSQTYPFRVRGNQIRVLSGTVPVKNALVYRLNGDADLSTEAQPLATSANVPLVTDHNGYLAGRATLNIGDQLVALYPISTTDTYTLYYTSGAPTESGLSFDSIEEGGRQRLRVSKDNPLLLFDLDLSLEWDARNDVTFFTQVETAIKQASSLLYDVSNGQVAVGQVNVYQAKENWTDSHIVVYGSNSIRPSANIGGVVLTSTHDIGLTGVISDAYLPGQIRMGPNWDPFGQNSSELSQEWWRALAHELSHYMLFMPDNYIGISDSGRLVGLDCQGSFMTNTYDDNYSEFLTAAGWSGDCLQTIAARTTGRTDWQTISTFYPMLNRRQNDGPSVLPLNVTQVTFMPISSDETDSSPTLSAKNYDLRNEESGALLALPRAQGYLFKTQATDDLTDDVVMPLGTSSANGDRIKVRGAEAADRLCVFGQDALWIGCQALTSLTASVPMSEVSDWQPSIEVTPITSRTLIITATLSAPVNNLNVQVFPAHANPLTPTITSAPWSAMTPLDPANPVIFSQVITMDYGAFEGLVRIWVPDSNETLEAVSQFYLSADVWGSQSRGWGSQSRGWGSQSRGWGAPMTSAEGQLTVFNVDNPYGQTGTSAFQTLNSVPNLPSWFTVVGHGYRVTLQENFTQTIRRTLSFDYLQSDVPDGMEYTLNIYHSSDEGTTWQRLSTDVDQDDNRATTLMPDGGGGIYALISTIEVPLRTAGWNLFAYPVQTTRTISDALQSINGYYSTLYGYDGSTPDDPWRVYDSSAESWVNTLHQLEYGQGYWIYLTQPITLALPIDTTSTSRRAASLMSPPATYYGVISNDQIQASTTVTAWVGDVQCGQTQTRTIDPSTSSGHRTQLVYAINVWSEAQKAGCGAPGRTVTFQIGTQPMSTTATWDNSQVSSQPLYSKNYLFYFPLISR
ncbi:MAG: FG-GAP repeat domain-containing protein [Ardenticatenaceae bacterium]